MTLKTQMATDLDVFFNTDDFAESVTYNGESIDAVIEYLEDLGNEGSGRSSSKLARARMQVKASDVADPDYRDTVVIGSDTWYVANIVSGDGFSWVLEIRRDERPVI